MEEASANEMKLVIMESPFAGNPIERWQNRRYARKCLRDCLLRGESPLASHLLYTQTLRDSDPLERQLGIKAGLAWRYAVDLVVFYIDRGMSPGMSAALRVYERESIPYEYRRLTDTPARVNPRFTDLPV